MRQRGGLITKNDLAFSGPYHIMKKIIGVIFCLAGTFLSFVLIGQLRFLLSALMNASGEAESIGYVFGAGIVFLITAGVVFFLFKFGIKWLNEKKVQPALTLDEEFKVDKE